MLILMYTDLSLLPLLLFTLFHSFSFSLVLYLSSLSVLPFFSFFLPSCVAPGGGTWVKPAKLPGVTPVQSLCHAGWHYGITAAGAGVPGEQPHGNKRSRLIKINK